MLPDFEEVKVEVKAEPHSFQSGKNTQSPGKPRNALVAKKASEEGSSSKSSGASEIQPTIPEEPTRRSSRRQTAKEATEVGKAGEVEKVAKASQKRGSESSEIPPSVLEETSKRSARQLRGPTEAHTTKRDPSSSQKVKDLWEVDDMETGTSDAEDETPLRTSKRARKAVEATEVTEPPRKATRLDPGTTKDGDNFFDFVDMGDAENKPEGSPEKRQIPETQASPPKRRITNDLSSSRSPRKGPRTMIAETQQTDAHDQTSSRCKTQLPPSQTRDKRLRSEDSGGSDGEQVQSPGKRARTEDVRLESRGPKGKTIILTGFINRSTVITQVKNHIVIK